jgi:hypothetical protein
MKPTQPSSQPAAAAAADPQSPPAASQTLDSAWLIGRVSHSAIVWIFAAEAILVALWLLTGYLKIPTFAAMRKEDEMPRGNRFLRDTMPDAANGAWGFNLDPALIPRDDILPSGPGKDDIPALLDPPSVGPEGWPYLPANAPVVGVALGGQSRAYPIYLLDRHECVNDTLGGWPIAVTRNGLAGATCVYSRRVGDEVLEFGVSGLVWQSNTLLFDRRLDPYDESLWSQVQGRAVTGPAAARGLALDRIDSDLTTWRDWLARHPDTTLPTAVNGFDLGYEDTPFKAYYRNRRLWFPIQGNLSRRPELRLKEPLVIVRLGDATKAYPIFDLLRAPGLAVRDELAGWPITLTLDQPTSRVTVGVDPAAPFPSGASSPPPIRRAYAFWFAWEVTHPDGQLYGIVAAEWKSADAPRFADRATVRTPSDVAQVLSGAAF